MTKLFDQTEDADTEASFAFEPEEAAAFSPALRDGRLQIAVDILKQMREAMDHVISLLELGETRAARTELLKMMT